MTWTMGLLALHLASAALALFQGTRALRAPRGGRRHRRRGQWYVAALLPLAGSAWALDALSARTDPTLSGLAAACLVSGLAAPVLAQSARPVLRSAHGYAACFSLACLGGAMLEVFLPGPWTWPAVGILALALKALSRPLPGRAGTGAVSQP